MEANQLFYFFILFATWNVLVYGDGVNTKEGSYSSTQQGSSPYKIHWTPSTWSKANQTCVNEGKQLLTIKNETVHNVYSDFVKRLHSYLADVELWIGLSTRSRHCTEYTWSDGQPLEQSYQNWGYTEPDNCPDSLCVRLKQLKWNTKECDEKYRFICENVDKIASESTTTTSVSSTTTPASTTTTPASTTTTSASTTTTPASTTTTSVSSTTTPASTTTTSASTTTTSTPSTTTTSSTTTALASTTATSASTTITSGPSTTTQESTTTTSASTTTTTSASSTTTSSSTTTAPTSTTTTPARTTTTLTLYDQTTSPPKDMWTTMDDGSSQKANTTDVSPASTPVDCSEICSGSYTPLGVTKVCGSVFWNSNTTLDGKVLEQEIKKLKEELTVTKTSTKMYIRSKISVYEERTSAKTIGIVGITVIAVSIGLVVIPDVVTLIKFVFKLRH